MNQLDELRKEIDRIDTEMAALFEQRMHTAAEIGAYKQKNNLPVLDSGREQAVIEKGIARIHTPELKDFYKDYLTHLMALSRQYQTRLSGKGRVAYQGVEGGFGHQVMLSLFPGSTAIPIPTFQEVFEAVEKEQVEYGIVPFENSSTGDVSGILDLCYTHNIYVAYMYDLPVSQNLLGLPGTKLSEIKTVISHPQGLQQSRRFLESLGVEQVPSTNTALAAKEVAQIGNPTVAAIASLEAGKLYGLVPIAKDISTEAENTTRFIVITKNQPTQGNAFSLLVSVKNEVGTLSGVIQTIVEHGFNMVCIKSRPLPKRNWEYYFYMELMGSPTGQQAKQLLEEIQRVSISVRLLGIFTREGQ